MDTSNLFKFVFNYIAQTVSLVAWGCGGVTPLVYPVILPPIQDAIYHVRDGIESKGPLGIVVNRQ